MDEESARQRLAALFDAHHQRLFRTALRLTRNPDDAGELVQEAFVRAAKHAHSLPDGDGAEGWLVRTLINLVRDRGRRQRVRRDRRHELPLPRIASSPEDRTVARHTVRHALQRLAPRRRAVVVLVELEGRSTSEVAALLGIRPVTVRWHLSRARRELRAFLSVEKGTKETES